MQATYKDLCFRIFGGLVADVKRKLPWYKSDFTDALHVQCVASFIYLFLATLTPNVTFGGLLSEATHDYMVWCIQSILYTFVGLNYWQFTIDNKLQKKIELSPLVHMLNIGMNHDNRLRF